MNWFRNKKAVTEQTKVSTLIKEYPHFEDFLKKRFRLTLDATQKKASLKELCRNEGLPPAPILFVEMQLAALPSISSIRASDAKKQIDTDPRLRILDVRETWELTYGKLPRSEKLEADLWTKLIQEEDRTRPLLVYCHFGIRSIDAANQLVEKGFTSVTVLEGGIQAWSTDVDASIPQYEGHWC